MDGAGPGFLDVELIDDAFDSAAMPGIPVGNRKICETIDAARAEERFRHELEGADRAGVEQDILMTAWGIVEDRSRAAFGQDGEFSETRFGNRVPGPDSD